MSEKRSKKVLRKGSYSDVQHDEPIGEAMVDVVLRHLCMLEAVHSLNTELEEVQKSVVEGIL